MRDMLGIIKGYMSKKKNSSIIYIGIIASVVILSAVLFNFEQVKTQEVEGVLDEITHDFTLQFNPENNTFTNSSTGQTITTSSLATMGITYTEVSGVDTVTFNGVNFVTSKNRAFVVTQGSKEYDVNVVLQGDNIIGSSYEQGYNTFVGLGNYGGGFNISGTGSLKVTTNNMFGSGTSTNFAIYSKGETVINSGTIKLYANGYNGTALRCMDKLTINNGNIEVHGGTSGASCGLYSSGIMTIKDGNIKVYVSSNDNRVSGIETGILGGKNSMIIYGGDISIDARGRIGSLDSLKAALAMHEDIVTGNGTTLSEVVSYIEKAKNEEDANSFTYLVTLINKNYTGGFSNYRNIINAIADVCCKVQGFAIGSNNIDITNANIDIYMEGMHKTGISLFTDVDTDSIYLGSNTNLSIKGDIDRSGIDSKSVMSAGIASEGGNIHFDSSKVVIKLDNTTKASSHLVGVYIEDNNMYFEQKSNVDIDVYEGFGIEKLGEKKIYVNGGRIVARAGQGAYNGKPSNMVFVGYSPMLASTGVIAVANDYKGIERVNLDIQSTRWLYQYMDLGELYDYSLYVDSDANVRKNNVTGEILSSAELYNLGISTSLSGNMVEVTFNNTNFATTKYNAFTAEANTIFNVVDGTINRLSGKSDGTEAGAVVKTKDMRLKGKGTLIIDNRYSGDTIADDSWKKCLSCDGTLRNAGTNIVLSGLDNCFNAIGVEVDSLVHNDNGSISILGGYKTVNITGIKGVNDEFIITAGEVNIYFVQTDYESSNRSISAVGCMLYNYLINGGKVNIDIDTVFGATYGMYGKGDSVDYGEYAQNGGVVKIVCNSDNTGKYVGGIYKMNSAVINDGTCEVSAKRVMNFVPVLNSAKEGIVTLVKAKDASGIDVEIMDINSVGNYSYVLIEPLYYYKFVSDTGKLYKCTDSGNVEADKNGWYAKLGNDGLYDLVLNGFHFSTQNSIGMYITDSQLDIILEEGSSNSISYNYNLNTGTRDYGVSIYLKDGTLNMSGKGNLNLYGNVYPAEDESTELTLGIWANNININNNCNINMDYYGPATYALYAKEKITLKDTYISMNIMKKNTLSTSKAVGLFAKDLDVDNSNIMISGGDSTYGLWSNSGVLNFTNSQINVNVGCGGVMATANQTNITNSTLDFRATNSLGSSYGIYTKNDAAQSVSIIESKINMDILGYEAIGIKSSSDIVMKDSDANIVINSTKSAEAIGSSATGTSIVGNIDIDNCNIIIGISQNGTPVSNYGISSALGSIDIYGSYIKAEIYGGDVKAIHAGSRFSNVPSDYDDRSISLKITECTMDLLVNGSNDSVNCIGVVSTKGSIDVLSSQIFVKNNKSGSTGLVIGVYGGSNVNITDASNITIKVEPEGVKCETVKGIYSLEGNVNISKASMVDMHITGTNVDGIFANVNVSIETNSELNIDIYDVVDIGIGINSKTGEIKLQNVGNNSTINVEGKSSTDAGYAMGLMGTNVSVENCVINIDACAKSGYAIFSQGKVLLSKGTITLNGSSSVVATINLVLGEDDNSDINARATRPVEVSYTYKDTDNIVEYPTANVLTKCAYAEIKTVPAWYYKYNVTEGNLYKVSYDGSNTEKLTSSTWPTGLSIEENKLVMKDFDFVTVAEKAIDIVGDGNVDIGGFNEITVASGLDNQHDGIYCSGNLDISGSTDGELKLRVTGMNNTRGIIAQNTLDITNANIEVTTVAEANSGLTSLNDKVAINMSEVEVYADTKNPLAQNAESIYGIYAKTNIDVLSSNIKVMGYTSALYLEQTDGSNIKGTVNASTLYSLSYVEAVTDINESYTDSISKYRAIAVTSMPISVTITWGDLEYECESAKWNTTKGTYEETSWVVKNAGGNLISVKNETEESISAVFSYDAKDNCKEISGVIKNVDDNTSILEKDCNIAAKSTFNAKLELSGQLSSNAQNLDVGVVTIMINE